MYSLNRRNVSCWACHWSKRHPNYMLHAKRPNQVLTFADYPVKATVSLDKDYILPAKRPQKSQGWALSVDPTKFSVEPIQSTQRNAKPGRRSESIASDLIETRLLDHAQRDSLPLDYSAEPFLEYIIVMSGFRDARDFTESFFICATN